MTLSKSSNRPPAQSSQPDASSDDSLAPGVLIGGRYRIDTLLGEGAMGRVYAAEHVLLRKKLAIKILHGDRAQVPEVVARFEREAMAAANIEHPNIAGASDFGRLADGSVYLVLEYVQGVNLRDELRKGPFSTERSLHIARQIASALAGAQELAIVHRDLKPENIMLIEKHGDPDFVKVLDFGIARVPMAEGPNEPLTKVGIVFGTPEYMAPEQALGQRVDGRADLYALGVILFEMLAGVRPYPAGAANIARQLSGHPPKIADRAPHVLVSGAVEAMVQKLLAPNVRDRFESAKELLAALETSIPPARAQRASTSPAQPTPPVGTPTGVRLPTFLPGDPLPAFELPADAPVPALVRPRPPLASGDVVEPGAVASRPPPEAPTLLRAPSLPPSGTPATTSGKPAPAEPARPSALVRAGRSANEIAAVVGARTIALYCRACRFVDRHRDGLPRFVRRRVKRVPAGMLLAVTGGALLLVAGVALFALRAPRPLSSGAVSAPPSGLSQRINAVPVRVEPEPNDAAGLLELALARLEEKRPADAVSLVGKALTVEPRLAEDAATSETLRAALRDGGEAVEDAVLALVRGPMGQRGADVVYDVSIDSSMPAPVRARAEAWLRTKEFDRVSSPALYSAVKLRFATTCAQKHSLLKLAGNVGGQRTLDYLKELERHVHCASDRATECYPCLASDERLKETISRLEQRQKG